MVVLRHCAWRIAVIVAAAVLGACASLRSTADLPWADARQLVLVVAPDWNAHAATLRTYARDAGEWRQHGAALPVVIGRSGSAWGIGEHPPQPGPRKREGDGRSPAGVFAIGTAFGYAPSGQTGLSYAALQEDDYCVDVSGSPLYNQIVSSRAVGADAVAGSTEPMRRDLHADGDPAYEFGFVVEHNPHGLAQGGSCIFVHLWKSADSATSGCTALAEPALRELLQWLRRDDHPVFVLLPSAQYRRLQAAWHLPLIPTD